MLIAWVIENLDQFCPFLALVSYIFKHFEEFWERALYFFWVEMVVLLKFHSISMYPVFLYIHEQVKASSSLRRQIDRMALILEKFRVLRTEYFSKKLPIPISLISFYIDHVLYFDSLQISVAYKCPYKNTELILEPIYRIACRLLLVKSGI